MPGLGALGGYALGAPGGGGPEEIVETLMLGATPGVAVGPRVAETLALAAVQTVVYTPHPLTDQLALSAALTEEVTTVLREFLQLAGTAEPQALYQATVLELLRLRDRVTPVLEALVGDLLALTADTTAAPVRYAVLTDALVLAGAAQTTVRAMAQLTDVLALRAALASVQEGQLQDALAFAEAVEAQRTALETVISAAVFSDEALGLAQFLVRVDDRFTLDAALDVRATFLAALRDTLDFSVGFVFDDVPYLGLSLNAATRALTSYSNVPFDSLASFRGRIYATGDGGLYRLGGDTDAGAPIVWRLRTGMTRLGTGRNKALDAVYLGYTGTGRVALKCIVVEPSGRKIAHWYELTPTAGSPHAGRLQVGRGLRSVYWGFELTNVDAGEIELDVVELHPVVLERRLP